MPTAHTHTQVRETTAPAIIDDNRRVRFLRFFFQKRDDNTTTRVNPNSGDNSTGCSVLRGVSLERAMPTFLLTMAKSRCCLCAIEATVGTVNHTTLNTMLKCFPRVPLRRAHEFTTIAASCAAATRTVVDSSGRIVLPFGSQDVPAEMLSHPYWNIDSAGPYDGPDWLEGMNEEGEALRNVFNVASGDRELLEGEGGGLRKSTRGWKA